jgi:hypothetical protein
MKRVQVFHLFLDASFFYLHIYRITHSASRWWHGKVEFGTWRQRFGIISNSKQFFFFCWDTGFGMIYGLPRQQNRGATCKMQPQVPNQPSRFISEIILILLEKCSQFSSHLVGKERETRGTLAILTAHGCVSHTNH